MSNTQRRRKFLQLLATLPVALAGCTDGNSSGSTPDTVSSTSDTTSSNNTNTTNQTKTRTITRLSEISGRVIEPVPSSVTINKFDHSSIQSNEYIRQTVVEAVNAYNPDSTEIEGSVTEVPPQDLDRTKEDLANLTHSNPDSDEAPRGYYVSYDGKTVVLTMVIND